HPDRVPDPGTDAGHADADHPRDPEHARGPDNARGPDHPSDADADGHPDAERPGHPGRGDEHPRAECTRDPDR
ncbi:hypothetical protein, partial [Curtobacterium sp. MCPF17_031]|uniref:hypothetical protein n=1 Tax=Curtobacterium sp. MCPF17_031 TaxID=2175653 RepID=UPI001C64E7C6